jgi:Rrf2 family nitric oxide-sensitive transcriptional repressor
MFVAAHPERQATVGEIAASYGISEHHLTKVVHFLGREGFLETVRGRGGGMRLARPARQISVAAVVRAAEGAVVPAACFDERTEGCTIARACRLHGVLRDAVDAFYAVLERTTLADLTGNNARLRLVMHNSAPRRSSA